MHVKCLDAQIIQPLPYKWRFQRKTGFFVFLKEAHLTAAPARWRWQAAQPGPRSGPLRCLPCHAGWKRPYSYRQRRFPEKLSASRKAYSLLLTARHFTTTCNSVT